MVCNGAVHIRHLCNKRTIISCHRYLIFTHAEKMPVASLYFSYKKIDS
jgi:hypothetical protein